jgi:transposase InsO family protein
MSADFNQKLYILPKFSPGQYHALMRSWINLVGFEENDAAKFRLAVLNHCYDFGWKAAVAAFKVPKSTLFDWKRRYQSSGRKLASLVPKSTKPHHAKLAVFDPRLVELVAYLRQEYGCISKYKLKLFLDEYARSLSIRSYGHSKIGKLIKRHNYFFNRPKKRKTKVKLLHPRLKRTPKETVPGYIEMDSVTVYITSHRYYFITAIDIVTKFAWVKLTRTLSSKQAALAVVEFKAQYQLIREIQTDNGHEFLGEFEIYLSQKNIPHQFIYPRSPKINGVVERFNRTLRDEFLNRNNSAGADTDTLNQHLLRYLSWYNTKRPHYSLNYMTPVQYLSRLHSEK